MYDTKIGGVYMRKSLLVIVLLAVILAMAVPFTMYIYQTEHAFTYDNVITNQLAGQGAVLP